MKIALIAGLCYGLMMAAPAARAEAQGSGEVSVAGPLLLRDGRPWTPHGFFQVAFATPPASFNLPGANPVLAAAYKNFTESEYRMMRKAGADSVRMNIAEDGADRKNAQFYDPQWLNQVVHAILAARAAGLVVIVSIQDEAQTGAEKSPLPDETTRRVWRELAPMFAHDLGVLYELYNEPNLHPDVAPKTDENTPPSGQDWAQWRTAMDAVIRVVRKAGALNVVVADGLVSAQQLNGAPKLHDPLHLVAYASHPYPLQSADQTVAVWDEKFGAFARSAPVIVTEWGPGYYCDADTPVATTRFLNYLNNRHIGLDVVAFDWTAYSFASAVQDYPNATFSSLLTPTSPDACTMQNHFQPGQGSGMSTSFGPGEAVRQWYVTGRPPVEPR